jgi:hypothetical protein
MLFQLPAITVFIPQVESIGYRLDLAKRSAVEHLKYILGSFFTALLIIGNTIYPGCIPYKL